MLSSLDAQQFWGAFFVLFAILDTPGSLPVIISLRKKGKIVNPMKVAVLAFIMFMIFYYVGEAFLNLFGVNIESFAVAGALILFVMAAEMILDISIFKESPDTPKDSSFFPVVFPLYVGAGALTTLLALRAQFAEINILLAVVANVVCIYIVLLITDRIEKMLGAGLSYMIKKFFGIILLAISIKLFTSNITPLIETYVGN